MATEPPLDIGPVLERVKANMMPFTNDLTIRRECFHACHKCNKHIRESHPSGPVLAKYGYPREPTACPPFLDLGANLRRCKSCGLAYYCSKECQKQDWSAHKFLCRGSAAENRDLLENHGKEMVERNISFKKFCDRNRITLNYIGMLALRNGAPGSLVGTHAFVVILDTTIEGADSTSAIATSSSQSPKRPIFHHKLRSAGPVPIDLAFEKYMPWHDEEGRTVLKNIGLINILAERDFQVLQVLIVDDGLPPPASTQLRPASIKPEFTARSRREFLEEGVWRTISESMINADDERAGEAKTGGREVDGF